MSVDLPPRWGPINEMIHNPRPPAGKPALSTYGLSPQFSSNLR